MGKSSTNKLVDNLIPEGEFVISVFELVHLFSRYRSITLGTTKKAKRWDAPCYQRSPTRTTQQSNGKFCQTGGSV